MLSSSEKYELKKKFRHLESQICKIDTALDSKADLVDGVVPTEQLPITQDIIDALNNANAPTGINYFTTLADLSSITPGTLINVAANYSALPAANTVPGEFYWVENSQGTSWLPGPLGGTYYPNGLYYSNGTTWIFTDVPFNATQIEVDAGLNNNKFVTPQTFANAAKWDTKFDNWTVTTANTGTLTGENVLWLVDTTAARTRTLDSAGSYVHIKDTTGNALTNNITINAPVGQTINGNASETIDADFGWVEYKLVGTDWVTTEGDSGAASNQLIVDSTPTNGSTNPVSSDGVYDALQLKQDNVSLTTTGTSGAATLVGSTLNIPQYQSVLTNPVTGTGTAGQVSYWSGTGTQTGSAELTWDNVNKRLGAGVTTPLYGIHHVGTAGAAGIVSVRDFTFNAIAQISQRASFVGYVTDASRGVAFGAVAAGGSLQSFANLPATAASNLILQPYGGDVSLGFATAPSARLHVRGSGTTSSTTALLVQNSTPSALLTILDNGSTTISGSTTAASALARGVNITSTLVAAANNDVLVGLDITPTYTVGGFTGVTRYDIRTSGSSLLGTSISFTNFSNISTSGLSQSNSSLIIRGGQGSAVGNINLINFQSNNPITSTSNNPFLLGTFISFEPTSGNANFGIFNIAGTINQTGGANGITRGLYVNPTLTAAADWRSIEWSNNTGWGLYGAGTAANYLAGNTSIGTTTRSGRLTVRGETTTSASNGLLVEDSAGTDTFTVRNDGGYAFKGGTVGVAQTGYTTFTNLVTDRTCDANATTVEELADILGTLIEDLKTKGIISA